MIALVEQQQTTFSRRENTLQQKNFKELNLVLLKR